MTLEEVSHVTDTKLAVNTTLSRGFCASFVGLELFNGCVLTSACGFGETETEAREALALRVSDERAVTGGLSGPRQNYYLPTVTA